MTRKLRILLASALAVAFLGGSAMAQTAAKKASGDKAASGQKVKNYDFSGDDIEGEIIKPDGDDLTARKFADHASLIRVRTDFIREIVKAAEDI
jgi:hypothetical protein